jgi:hypothetical protein
MLKYLGELYYDDKKRDPNLIVAQMVHFSNDKNDCMICPIGCLICNYDAILAKTSKSY